MSTLDLKNIEVLNFNGTKVFIETSSNRYKINEAKEDGTPSIITLPISELKYIASNTDVFNIGVLTFDEKHKEEIFKELRINGWKEILTNEEIKAILLKPSQEGLQKILNIKNPAYFERVRTILHILKADGASVTARVVDLVNRRYHELANRIRNTRIQLVEKDTRAVAAQEDVNAIKAQNEALQAQMAEMQRMMEKMLKNQAVKPEVESVVSESADENIEETADTPEPKKRGRPAKKNK